MDTPRRARSRRPSGTRGCMSRAASATWKARARETMWMRRGSRTPRGEPRSECESEESFGLRGEGSKAAAAVQGDADGGNNYSSRGGDNSGGVAEDDDADRDGEGEPENETEPVLLSTPPTHFMNISSERTEPLPLPPALTSASGRPAHVHAPRSACVRPRPHRPRPPRPSRAWPHSGSPHVRVRQHLRHAHLRRRAVAFALMAPSRFRFHLQLTLQLEWPLGWMNTTSHPIGIQKLGSRITTDGVVDSTARRPSTYFYYRQGKTGPALCAAAPCS
ncbi:hypothetical protein MVEN_01074700 [Mycena venus]|uniref:Uncharacterized protein n=1 Tax=Mycena venus TaxID=2733690 RepID=A0A8H6Y5Z2_9AGAR|nr:hypothetical protein MVEN_01074700 [Mycena venus]